MKFSYRSEKTHQKHILEGLYRKMIRCSEQLRTVLALYDQDVQQKDFLPSCQNLKTHGEEVLGLKRYGIEILTPEMCGFWSSSCLTSHP